MENLGIDPVTSRMLSSARPLELIPRNTIVHLLKMIRFKEAQRSVRVIRHSKVVIFALLGCWKKRVNHKNLPLL